jgi:hypothetical protein
MKVRVVWLLGFLLLSAGCASHEVRCDGRLEPINAARVPAGPDANGPDTRSRGEK